MATKSLCSVDGCCKPARTRGWCPTHYSRWLIHGDPLILKCPPNGTLSNWITAHSNYDDDACLIWPFSRNPSGYACQVQMDGETAYAHDHMCRLNLGPKPHAGSEVAHSCGNGHVGCVNPKHLRWVTRAENMQDMIAHGRTNRGRKAPSSRLTEDDVRNIRSLSGMVPQREIASRYSVSQGIVSLIVLRKRWAWLE